MRDLETRQGEDRVSDEVNLSVYRAQNLDLRDAGLTDAELRSHFVEHGAHDRRTYAATSSNVEALSMRWLRGRGLEIGAGSFPTPLFGGAAATYADIDADLMFGGEAVSYRFAIDGDDIPGELAARFDFVIASHVLEHCDSFLRAIRNLCALARPGGIVYLVLPDIGYLGDVRWIPNFDFAHHIEEFGDKLIHAELHDQIYLDVVQPNLVFRNQFLNCSESYLEELRVGKISQPNRFIHHKHNYCYGDWVELMVRTHEFFGKVFALKDSRFASERCDCHFILEVA
jgi:SAM-dependent methyltransferase